MTQSTLDQCYTALGFSRPPFSISPDTSLFYPHSQHVSAYNNIRFAMQGGVMAVLTAEVGLGKTLICRYLLRNAPSNVRTALLVTPMLSYEEILASIYKDFTGEELLEGNSIRETLEQLMAYAITRAALGEHLVVMVDEAQKLSTEALEGLRLLSNLETEQRKLISLVLVGQPELEKTLALRSMRPMRERIGVWCRLRPMTRTECANYIQHRLTRTKTTGAIHFSTMAIFMLHHFAKGVPRRVNLLCDRILLLAFATDKNLITWSMVRQAAADMAPGRDV